MSNFTVTINNVDVLVTGEGVRVGVIDTGANITSLSNNREHGTEGTNNWNVVAGKDFIDDERPEIDVEGEDFDAISDGNGHGEFVANQIAHPNYGVAPDADLIIARALDDEGSGSTEGIVDAIYWCAEQGAEVINMSLGSPLYSEAMAREIQYVLESDEHDVKAVCVAVGNDRHGTRWVASPADTLDYAIGVAAVSPDEAGEAESAYFSNIGPDDGIGDGSLGETRGANPWIAAPGMKVQTEVARPGGSHMETDLSGTSMACPIVAGAIALLLENEPDLTWQEVRQRVADTAEPLPHCGVTEVGHGMIDIGNLVNDEEQDTDQESARSTSAESRDGFHSGLGGRFFGGL